MNKNLLTVHSQPTNYEIITYFLFNFLLQTNVTKKWPFGNVISVRNSNALNKHNSNVTKKRNNNEQINNVIVT